VPTANELLVVRRTLCADEFVTLRRSVQRMSLGLKEPRMRQVTSSASMSLDGYIARNDNTIGQLFDWLQNGDVEVPTVDDRITFHMSPTSAAYWRSWMDGIGALVCGRTLFDFTAGWGGQHTMGVPVVVVTHEIPTDWVEDHPDAPFHFVTDGVEVAVARAQELAGNATVAVTAGTIARQCLELGLLDAVAVDLVPVVMGRGRPYFGELSTDDVVLGDPIEYVAGQRVTHLVFPVTTPSNDAVVGRR
jgi:dihydrofolate reductase